MKLRSLVRFVLWSLLAVVLCIALTGGGVWWYFHPSITRNAGIVYTERHGHKLTFDIVRPAHPNGLGILLMVSGGWHSEPQDFRPFMVAPLLRRGYTVFAISHLSQPKATVMEIVEDVNRAVRFIRFHAQDYRIDPDHLGVTGGSAGGHLSLMLAARGGPGPGDATDLVDRASSAIQAAAIFFPVTDLLNLGPSTENLGDGGPPKSFVKAFGPQSTNLAVWKIIGREMSPIYHVTTNLPPVLIIHGGADTLVPPEQSEHFQTQARAIGRNVELIIRPGKQHGWLTMLWDIGLCADWFDKYLRP